MKIYTQIRFVMALLMVLTMTISVAQKNTKYDEKAGKEGARQIIAQMGLVNNPVTEAYITEIGQRLVIGLANKEFDYKFHIVDMVEPNAFALPGGYIYISRGLLAIMNSEDEIACVLGHEIIHSNHRHSYRQMKKSIFPSLLQLPGNIIATVNEDLGSLINAPLEVAGRFNLARYSRKQEYEADEFGVKLVSKSGYNPEALATALANISKEVELLTGEKEKFSYFDNHPFTEDRLEKIHEISSGLTWKAEDGIVSDKLALYKKLEGLYLGQNPVQGIFRENNFYQVQLNLAIEFPEKWNGTNNPSYVGATEPNRKASIMLGILGQGINPHDMADAYIAKMKEKYDIEAYKSEKLNINGFDAHIFAIDEVSGRDINNITIVWVNKSGLTLQMIGAGRKEFEKDFVATAKSFHSLTSEEKRRITGTVLRVATAKNQESLHELSTRTGNVLKTTFVALLNDIDENVGLKDGQPVKYGKLELYPPKR